MGTSARMKKKKLKLSPRFLPIFGAPGTGRIANMTKGDWAELTKIIPLPPTVLVLGKKHLGSKKKRVLTTKTIKISADAPEML